MSRYGVTTGLLRMGVVVSRGGVGVVTMFGTDEVVIFDDVMSSTVEEDMIIVYIYTSNEYNELTNFY